MASGNDGLLRRLKDPEDQFTERKLEGAGPREFRKTIENAGVIRLETRGNRRFPTPRKAKSKAQWGLFKASGVGSERVDAVESCEGRGCRLVRPGRGILGSMRAMLWCVLLAATVAGCAVVVADEPAGRGPIYVPGPVAAPKIPPGHMPPPGSCRIWFPGRPPGHQPPPGPCEELQYRVPPGAYLIRG